MSLKDWFQQPKKISEKLTGYRTYIVVLAAVIMAALEAFEVYTPPVWVWTVLGFAGVGFLRAGVKGMVKPMQEMIKSADAMKIILVCLCLFSIVGCDEQSKVRPTIWGMTSQDVDSRNVALTGRVGAKYGYIQGFIGSTWRPNYDVESGEIKPPQVMTFGTITHMRDLLDPNNPLPWIPDTLLAMLPEKMVARPYFGGQGTWDLLDTDGSFYGPIIGVESKMSEDSKASLITEFQYNRYSGDMSALDDNEWSLNLGILFEL